MGFLCSLVIVVILKPANRLSCSVGERAARGMVEREGKGEPATAHCIFEIGSFHASIICQNNQIEQANQICRVFALFIQSHLSKQFSRRFLQLYDSVSVSSKQETPKKSQLRT